MAGETVQVHGQVVVSKGEVITAPVMQELRDAGLVGASLGGDDVAAAVLAALLGATALAGYLYLFQPGGVHSARHLLMVTVLVVAPSWLRSSIFLAHLLPDEARHFLAYMLPLAAVPMLLATLLEAELASPPSLS